MGGSIKRNPPWLMWGNKQTVEIPLIVGSAKSTGSQLLKIAYGRPEAWRFLFVARVIQQSTAAPGQHPVTELIVDFNVLTGIGRSLASLERLPNSTNQPGFERYIFAGNPIVPTDANAYKWSTSVSGPPRLDVGTNVPNMTDVIVGQDIQVNVTVLSTCSMDQPNLILEVGAFFSPNVHIRPEWFIKGGDFRGDEDETL